VRARRSTTFCPILVKELRRAVDAVEEGGRRVAGITVAVPGITDVGRGVVVRAPNLGWRDVPLRERLVEGLGREMPIELDNEANLGALAEFRKGALAGTPHLVYVLAVNGVGAGVIIDGSVFRGATGAAGEVGSHHGAAAGFAVRMRQHRMLGDDRRPARTAVRRGAGSAGEPVARSSPQPGSARWRRWCRGHAPTTRSR
jgi:hypothetical protein